MIARFFTRQAEFDVFAMSDQDIDEAAAIHSERFRRSWDGDELHSLLVQKPVFGFVVRQTNTAARPLAGFVLARAVAGEAEILTIAVSAKTVRRGLGWRLMRAALREAHARDAEAVFLEVDEGNAAALTLYRNLGFIKVGERKAYYDRPGGGASTALVMRCALTS